MPLVKTKKGDNKQEINMIKMSDISKDGAAGYTDMFKEMNKMLSSPVLQVAAVVAGKYFAQKAAAAPKNDAASPTNDMEAMIAGIEGRKDIF